MTDAKLADHRHYCVYVIRLRDEVLARPKFVRENPAYVPGKPCVYVGMTGMSPEERFANHRNGIKASRYVARYGMYLMVRKFRKLRQLTFEEAQAWEKRLAERLRRRGYAVWQR